ncbi:MAG: Gfo/Idh/MocA family oxidoreductase [Cyclobacteriaceae bacterium]|nr:Gfo/Idh/MocA family oxidoreductase [Cyclobacteriaceae bacterium]
MKSSFTFRQYSRRNFVKTASASFSAPFIFSFAHAKKRKVSPSDKIHLGLIGCGSLGKSNLKECVTHPNVVVTAACDVWQQRLQEVVNLHKDTCTAYTDFRDMLQHDGLDAVIIATPPHWHALIAIEAAKAGIHFYLEKPMTLHLAESLAVRNAVRKHKLICQIGTQIHAGEHYRRMVEFVRSGNLGPIGAIRTFCVMNEAPKGIGKGYNTDKIPEGLNWDMWLGPGPKHPFNPHLAKDAFHHSFWMDYSGGWTPGMAPHIIDLPIWALDLGYPLETSASGGRYIIDDDGDAYDHHDVVWKYPNLTMTWAHNTTNSYGFDVLKSNESKRRHGVYFHGNNGTLVTNYSDHQIFPEGDRMLNMHEVPKSIPPSPGHRLEWIDAIKNGSQPLCNPEYHVKIDVAIALSILSMRLGRTIKFDPVKEKIIGDKEAARIAIPTYRSPWKFPTEYL